MMTVKSFLLLVVGLNLSIQGVQSQVIHFEKVKNMPVPLYGMISVTDDEKIYVLGGRSYYDEKSNYVLIYHTRLNSWLDVSDSFEHFENGGITSVAYLKGYGNLLVTGNSLVNDSIQSISVFYDAQKYKPSLVLENPVNNFFQSSTYYKDRAYFWGGHKPFENSTSYEGSSSSFYFLDLSKLSFGNLQDMPTEAVSKGLIVENKLYLIGGVSIINTSLEFANKVFWDNRVHFYDFDSKQWNLFTELPNSIQNFTISSFENYLFLLHNGEKSVQITVMDLNTKKISQLQTKIHVRDYTSVVAGDQLYIMGGRKSDSPTKKVYRVSCRELVEALKKPSKG